MRLRTIREACKECNVAEWTLRRAVADGRIPHLLLGNRLLVDVDCDEFSQLHPEGMSLIEVSECTGMSVSAIMRGIRDGWIPAQMIAHKYYLDIDQVTSAIKKRMTRGQTGGEPCEPEP